MQKVIENLISAIATDRDWSLSSQDAWLYGVIIGWDDEYDEIQKKHSWNDETISRLKRDHARFHSALPDLLISTMPDKFIHVDYYPVFKCSECGFSVSVIDLLRKWKANFNHICHKENT